MMHDRPGRPADLVDLKLNSVDVALRWKHFESRHSQMSALWHELNDSAVLFLKRLRIRKVCGWLQACHIAIFIAGSVLPERKAWKLGHVKSKA